MLGGVGFVSLHLPSEVIRVEAESGCAAMKATTVTSGHSQGPVLMSAGPAQPACRARVPQPTTHCAELVRLSWRSGALSLSK